MRCEASRAHRHLPRPRSDDCPWDWRDLGDIHRSERGSASAPALSRPRSPRTRLVVRTTRPPHLALAAGTRGHLAPCDDARWRCRTRRSAICDNGLGRAGRAPARRRLRLVLPVARRPRGCRARVRRTGRPRRRTGGRGPRARFLAAPFRRVSINRRQGDRPRWASVHGHRDSAQIVQHRASELCLPGPSRCVGASAATPADPRP